MFMILSLLALIALPVSTDHADNCCGFTVNRTDSLYSAVFTEVFETDFLHGYDVTIDSLHEHGWTPQVYNVTPGAARGPYGKAAMLDSVRGNPIGNQWDWVGPGIRGADPGLQLWVRNMLVGDAGELMVPMGEIVSKRADMLYGSFRIGVKYTSQPGTCSAFFWYRNDSQEIDVEYLSREQNQTAHPVNLVVQSPESVQQGYNANGTEDFTAYHLVFAPDEEYHEYRFDWLPDRVDFYVDGMPMRSMRDSIPDAPGHLMVNHWSNGNQGWSGGPPKQDAVMTISYVKAYFNTTDSIRNTMLVPGCTPCQIPDQLTPPDPAGFSGNSSGRTFFFSHNASQTAPTTVYSGLAGSTPTSGAPRPIAQQASAPSGASLVCAVLLLLYILRILFFR